jgi:hypothetical protein
MFFIEKALLFGELTSRGFSFFTSKFTKVSQRSTKYSLTKAMKAHLVTAMGATHGIENS